MDLLNSFEKGSNIKRFIEKPSLRDAEEYIKHDKFFWNSGIFLFRANDFLKELKKFKPEIIENCLNSLERSQSDLDFERIEIKHFSNCENISLDVAVMEKTNLGTVIKLDAGWDDLGSWKSLWDSEKKDQFGNVIKGKVLDEKSSNCYLQSENRLLVGIGLKNKFTYDLAMAEKTADLTINNLSLHSDEQSPQLSNAKLSIKLVDDNVNILTFNGTLSKESKINFVGGIENVFSYLLLKNADLKIAGNLSSDQMIIDEFLDGSDKNSETPLETSPQEINLPNDIVANINLNLVDLTL